MRRQMLGAGDQPRAGTASTGINSIGSEVLG